jgi:hypothetical protein
LLGGRKAGVAAQRETYIGFDGHRVIERALLKQEAYFLACLVQLV